MHRPIQIHPASLLVGLVFGFLVLVSMSQASVALKDPWPPAKCDIVNFLSPYNPSTGLTYLLPGRRLTVYTVPNDRWLTVTGAVEFHSNANPVYWAEDLAGAVTIKGIADAGMSTAEGLLESPVSSGGPIGWTFRPGSRLVVVNMDAARTADIATYGFIGYLSRE